MYPRSVRTSVGVALCFLLAVVSRPVRSTPSADAFGALEAVELPAFSLTATRFATPITELPYSVSYRGLDALLDKSPRNFADMLAETPGIMIQRTGYGQSSPYLRGFTGFHTLLLIDGVRINNSVFRSGPNQYWGTVGTSGVAGIDILKGPASVQFGSDAVGGAVQLVTEDPHERLGQGALGFVGARYATAEDSWGGRFGTVFALGEEGAVGFYGSARRFGDLAGGSKVGRQKGTGYEERDGSLAYSRRIGEGLEAKFLLQAYAQENVPRTHATIYGIDWEGLSSGSDQRRAYDQERTLAYARIGSVAPGEDGLRWRATLSWQNQGEEEDRIRGNGNRSLQGFGVSTWGLSLDAERALLGGVVVVGAEHYRDEIDAYRQSVDASGRALSQAIQGPVADDSSYDLSGVFGQFRKELGSSLSGHLGLRYTHAEAVAGRYEDPLTGEAKALERRWGKLVGNARLLWNSRGEQPWTAFAGVAQAFRAPNLSDLTRLDIARSGELETPSPRLESEDFVTYEVGLRRHAGLGSFEASLFRTEIENQIIRAPTGRTIDLGGGEGLDEVTKLNSGRGFIQGLELSGTTRFSDTGSLYANLTWMEGRLRVYPDLGAGSELVEEPVSRMMPATLVAGWRRDFPGRRAFLEARVRASARQDRLASSDRRDTQRIPAGGTPGYAVLDLIGAVPMGESGRLRLLLENVFDEDYRIHGSGHNMAGRNLALDFEYSF